MSYVVSVRRSAQRELEAIASPFQQKIEERMLSLGDNARPAGCKMLKGSEKSWRIRIGDYRLVYEIDDSAKTVTVIKIRPPKQCLPLASSLVFPFYFRDQFSAVEANVYRVACGYLGGVT